MCVCIELYWAPLLSVLVLLVCCWCVAFLALSFGLESGKERWEERKKGGRGYGCAPDSRSQALLSPHKPSEGPRVFVLCHRQQHTSNHLVASPSLYSSGVRAIGRHTPVAHFPTAFRP